MFSDVGLAPNVVSIECYDFQRSMKCYWNYSCAVWFLSCLRVDLCAAPSSDISPSLRPYFPLFRRIPPAGLLVEKFVVTPPRRLLHVWVFGSSSCSFGLECTWYWGKLCNVTCTLVFFIKEVIYMYILLCNFLFHSDIYVGPPCVFFAPLPPLYPPRFPIRLVYLTYSVFIIWSG
jgi:hypothetical protein